MIARWLLANGTMLAACSLASCEENVTATESPVATRDVIYFHRSNPVFLRLHLQVDNASFDAPWLKYIESLFQHVDTDHDGLLTLEETQNTRDKRSTEIASMLRMRDLWTADESPFDRVITLPELTQFLISRGRGPFQPPTNQLPPPGSNNVGESLFDRLDADEDRQLSAKEVSNALQTMHRHDLDDDGTFSASELMPRARTFFVAPASQPGVTTAVQFVALIPGTSPVGVLQGIVNRYGKSNGVGSPDSDLTAKDLGLDATVFARFDVDSSGALDYDELRQFVKNPPPTLELMIRLGETDGAAPVVAMIHSSAESASVRTTDQLVSIVLDDVQIEIAQETSGVDSVRKYLARQFKNADQDNNKYLEQKEIQNNRVFDASFNEFDRDGDGKMFAEEMNAAIEAKAEVARTRTRLSVRNRGRDLFQIFDSDRNRQLSRREFAEAALRIELWDNDTDGAIGSNEVPQLFQLLLGPGQPVFRGLQMQIQGTQVAANTNLTGPLWFQKMDRNNDGELSRREFPGTRDELRRLDSDSNGIVDAAEAAQVAGSREE